MYRSCSARERYGLTFSILQGWNEDAAAVKEFWSASLDERFSGSAGARKLWMILVTIKERDDLVCRLKDLSCPFWVIHGQQDMAIPVEAVKRELKYIAHIKNTRFEVIPNGTHFLTQSKPEACDSFALNMIKVMNSI